ncbi:hypothetical protein FPQ18DRAFT_399026 [Pyronema domesticum]|nr:hypothetical protein FPQ18DRAFT_399026 [Pyronema domesticum]
MGLFSRSSSPRSHPKSNVSRSASPSNTGAQSILPAPESTTTKPSEVLQLVCACYQIQDATRYKCKHEIGYGLMNWRVDKCPIVKLHGEVVACYKAENNTNPESPKLIVTKRLDKWCPTCATCTCSLRPRYYLACRHHLLDRKACPAAEFNGSKRCPKGQDFLWCQTGYNDIDTKLDWKEKDGLCWECEIKTVRWKPYPNRSIDEYNCVHMGDGCFPMDEARRPKQAEEV